MKTPKTITSLTDVQLDPRNANRHTARGTAMMETSIREVGFGDSIVVDRNGHVLSGGQRTETTMDLGMTNPVVVQTDGTRPVIHQRTDLDYQDPRAVRLALLSNRVGQVNLDWDPEVLQQLQAAGTDLSDIWFPDELEQLFNLPAPDDPAEGRATLVERFGVPPFSVLDARQGYWQDRKRAWLALGIESELGRGNTEVNSPHEGHGMANGLVAIRAKQKAAKTDRPTDRPTQGSRQNVMLSEVGTRRPAARRARP